MLRRRLGLKLYYNIEYTLNKHDLTKEVIQRINTVLNINRAMDGPNYFYLADSPIAGGVSSIKRILKRFPELDKYVFEHEEKIGNETHTYLVLSNFPNDDYFQMGGSVVEGKNKDNIRFEILLEIIEGIPRKLPLHKAVFLFDQLNWSQKVNVINEHVYNMSSILYANNWWMPKRDISLFANVSVSESANEKDCLQPLSDELNHTLLQLGTIKKKSLQCLLNQGEKAKFETVWYECNQLISSFRKNMVNNNPFVFPHALIENHEHFTTLPRKQTVSKMMKKLGYKHLPKEGFHGVIVYGKLTKQNHRILLEFDSGRGFFDLRCNFILEGPYWKHRMEELPCRPNSYGDFFPIPDIETLEKVVENFSVVIQYLEETIVKDIEKLYGPAPKWFDYEG